MRQVVVIIWSQFGPYHMDRCEALARNAEDGCAVHGIEIASASHRYAWAVTGPGRGFQKHTLFPNTKFEETTVAQRVLASIRICRRVGAQNVFLTNYDRPDTFLLAALLRLHRVRVYLMCESKFDDKPRRVWRELLKSFALVPYYGALAAGPRSEAYLRFLGFRKRPVVTGSNAVALDELVELAGCPPAPAGPPFTDRHFVLVGRFVPKKDIATAIAAYARYRELAGETARKFHICGSGPLQCQIEKQIADLKLDGVVLNGFLQRDGIARVLSDGLALIVPSVEEQWGLVVNEALAFNLPVLATDQVGARDLLIRTGVNGYVFEPGNVDGLAHLMYRVGHDEAEWRRMVEGSHQLRDLGDSARFAEAVSALIQSRP